jgi:hypothetical protein
MSEYILFENEKEKLVLNEASGSYFNMTVENKLIRGKPPYEEIPFILKENLDLEGLKIMRNNLDRVISYFED